jgi:hypothetical protein
LFICAGLERHGLFTHSKQPAIIFLLIIRNLKKSGADCMKELLLFFMFISLLCNILIAIDLTDSEFEIVQHNISSAIHASGRLAIIEMCEQFDAVLFPESKRKQIVNFLRECFNQFTGERKLNAACFLLYFGEDYSGYIFYAFTKYYFCNSEGNEANYLDLSNLAGRINNIYAANLKIQICNAISTNSNIDDLLIMYMGMSAKSKFFYIFMRICWIAEKR